jgi:hypothetical protein
MNSHQSRHEKGDTLRGSKRSMSSLFITLTNQLRPVTNDQTLFNIEGQQFISPFQIVVFVFIFNT